MQKKSLLDVERETVSQKDLRALQLKKLRKSVAFVGERSLFYRDKKGISEESARFRSFEEFAQSIPFTEKADLLQNEMYENLCVPRQEIAEVHFSSGTSTTPVHSFLTQKDIAMSSEYLARTWYMQGVRAESAFAMFASYGLFSAGLINHYALQRIGAFIVPAGNASAPKSLQLLNDFSADACAAVASYYTYLIAAAEAAGLDVGTLHLKHLIAGGEPFSEQQRAYIEQKFGASLYNQYGLCEVNTGIAGECSEKNGLHILADYVYPEIIDPDTGAVLDDGQEGELVLTTFHKEASPLVRYRTGDITNITYKRCPCGRTMPRIAAIRRRVVDTLFYKGIKIEKPYIAQMMEGLGSYVNPYVWQLEARSVAGRDEIIFTVAPGKGKKANSKDALQHVASHVQKHLNLKVHVAFFSDEALGVLANGKFKHFVDNRRV